MLRAPTTRATTRFLVALLIVGVTGAGGCKKFPDLGGIDLSRYAPKVKFDRMKVKEVDFEGFDATFDFDIDNPNPVGLRLTRFDYDLALEGNGFLSGDSDEGLELAAGGSSKVRLPARIRFADVFGVVTDLKGKDEVGFGLEGTFGIGTPLGPLDVPFREEGSFATLKAPRIAAKKLKLAQVNLLQQRAVLDLDLEVTNRARSNAYGLREFGYGVDLGGARVVDGTLDDLEVGAGQSRVVTVPIQLDLRQLGATLVNTITQKRPVDLRLAADVRVQTPLGAIPFDVDETVDLQIQ